MKKMMALLLTAVILCVPMLASADVGFVTLVSTLLQEDFLGDPDSAGYMPEDYDLDFVLVSVVLDEGTFTIIGKTEDGQYAGFYWLNREAGQLMSLLYAISANYEALSEDCENGLVLAFKTGADTDFAYVADAESAAYLCAIITDALNTGAAAEELAVTEAE